MLNNFILTVFNIKFMFYSALFIDKLQSKGSESSLV